MRPTARKESLIVEQLPDETLVYDQKTDKAHCLNPTAAFVWRHCDGETSVREIARLLKTEMKTPANEEMVWLALERLDKSKLLAEPLERPADMALISRRDVAKRLGLVGGLAAVLPLVTSIVAPYAAEAASSCGTKNNNGSNCNCSVSTPCAVGSGFVCQAPNTFNPMGTPCTCRSVSCV